MPHFEQRRLLEGGTYSDLSVDGATLIRGRGLSGTGKKWKKYGISLRIPYSYNNQTLLIW